jgi:hypothetical protein
VHSSIVSWAPYDLLERMLYPDPEPRQQQHQQQQVDPCTAASVTGYSPGTDAGLLGDQQQQLVRLPHVLVRAALHDVEVPIASPVKVLARMRRLTNVDITQQQQQQQQSLLLLRVVPGGHLAFERDTKESAFKLAFLQAATAGALESSSSQ